jgi:prepilin-type N-terminal cleavage/methylation domain-containing protein
LCIVTSRRRGFTLIEIMLVIVLIGIFATWAVTRVNLGGFKMDAAARMLQNVIIGAQQTAITRSTEVTLRFDRQNSKVEVRFMEGGSQRVVTRPLPDGTDFFIPSVGTTGAPSDFVGGPGVEAAGGTTYIRDVKIAANGTVPRGDVFIYLGTSSARPQDQRALAVKGATLRTTLWSYNSLAWLVRDY